MDAENLNLNSLISQQKYQIKINSENFEDPNDADLRRFKDKWLFIVTMILIMFSFIGWFMFIALNPDSRYLGNVINAGFGLLMALVGYYVGTKK